MKIELIKTLSEIKIDLPAFGSEKYLKYKSDEYGWFKSEKYILPFYISKKLIFRRMFFTSNLIEINKSTSVINDKIMEEKSFLTELIKRVKELKIDSIDVPDVNCIFNIVPDNVKYTEFGTYKIDLSKSEEELFSGLHSKHRNVIRKADKENVKIYFGKNNFEICYKLIKDTFKRQKKSFLDINKFYELDNALNGNIEYVTAVKDNTVQGCAVLVWNKNYSSYYYFGGSIDRPFTGSLNLLQWKAICEMKNRGVLYYDFLGARLDPEKGSKLEGIQRFKERFGGDLITGYLWKYPVKPFKYFLFNVVYKGYGLLKGIKYSGDIVDQENKRKNIINKYKIDN